MIRNQKGISLLELILVLAITASAVVFGLRLYSQFQYQINEQRVFANVDQLFSAMNNFYRANCRQALDKNGNRLSTGRLDPSVTDRFGFANGIVLNVQNDLVTPGFLTSWQPLSPLLDNTAVPDQGYYVQYIRATGATTTSDPTTNAYACVGDAIPPSCNKREGAPLDQSQPIDPRNPSINHAAQSHAVRWIAQVAVKLSPTLTNAQWTQIMQDLNAQCVSSLSGSAVLSCTPTPAANGYIVWERSIYNVSPEIMSDYWLLDPYMKQFVNQYTNDPMAGLSNVNDETTNAGTGIQWYNAQNYLCGG